MRRGAPSWVAKPTPRLPPVSPAADGEGIEAEGIRHVVHLPRESQRAIAPCFHDLFKPLSRLK